MHIHVYTYPSKKRERRCALIAAHYTNLRTYQPTDEPKLSTLKKILIIAPSWVGDTVMAQPLLMRLKQRFPISTIDVYAPPWVAPLLRRMPEVNEVLVNPFGHGEVRLRERWHAARRLKKRGYDQALVLPNSLKSALLPFLAGIPQRTGFVGEMRYGLLNDTHSLDELATPLMVERFARLAEPQTQPLTRPLPSPALRVNEPQRDATLARLNLSTEIPIIAFCPGAEYGPAKRWPEEHFAALAKTLQAQGFQIWLVGSNKDQALGDTLNRTSGNLCQNLCGKTSLDEVVDLLSCADAVVSNDSGLMHIAAALNIPLVAIYGSSSPEFTPPLSLKARIVSLNLECSPCFKRECPLGHLDCLRKLEPRTILEKITRLLEKKPSA